ncbi:MAG: T9SS type A sorting domain-containing protein, partial [Cyclobacteriaceae bacterium]|nr:T9SS type A sorting domain-containing protein [Cyclobacteriaceae bacterium]
EVTFGTEFSALALPEMVSVELSNGSSEEVEVSWDEASYDPEEVADQIVTGEFVLPEFIVNSNSIDLTITVSVLEEEEDDDDGGDEDGDSGDEDGDSGDEDGDSGDEDADAGDEDGDSGDEDGDSGDEDGDSGDEEEETVTSIADSKLVEFNIHPNPASNMLTISLSNIEAGASLSVMDLSGREFLRVEKLEDKHQLDISNLKEGVYIMLFNDGTNQKTQRLIKR